MQVQTGRGHYTADHTNVIYTGRRVSVMSGKHASPLRHDDRSCLLEA